MHNKQMLHGTLFSIVKWVLLFSCDFDHCSLEQMQTYFVPRMGWLETPYRTQCEFVGPFIDNFIDSILQESELRSSGYSSPESQRRILCVHFFGLNDKLIYQVLPSYIAHRDPKHGWKKEAKNQHLFSKWETKTFWDRKNGCGVFLIPARYSTTCPRLFLHRTKIARLYHEVD